MDNLNIWNKVSRPPANALRQITGGRLNGKTDIKPQWRYQVMTENFGPCGVGWKYTIDKLWTETGADNQVFAFALVSLYIKHDGAWSDAIPGQGGSMLIEKESKGLFSSDEGFKMAITDALSVALKMLGVAAEVYMGNWDGSKFKNAPQAPQAKSKRQFVIEYLDSIKDRMTADQLAIIKYELSVARDSEDLLDEVVKKADAYLAANDKATLEAFEAGGFKKE